MGDEKANLAGSNATVRSDGCREFDCIDRSICEDLSYWLLESEVDFEYVVSR